MVGPENEQKAETLRYLEEVERRRLHLRLGYPSLFKFCIERYRMSEPSASKRIGAMRTGPQCNRFDAERDYGPLFIERKIEEARSVREAGAVYA